MGRIGEKFKHVLQKIAHELATIKKIKHEKK